MTQSEGLKSTTYLLRMTPAEKRDLERRAAAYTARTGQPMTLAAALRTGARQLLSEEPVGAT